MKKEKFHNEDVVDPTQEQAEDASTGGEPKCDANMSAGGADDAANSSAQAGKTDAQAEEWRDKYLRLHAEFDNYRKRTLREKMSLSEAAGEEVIRAMLPVVDDMDRALEAMRQSDDVQALRQGIELIAQKFCDVMRGRGLEEIEAKGRPFDLDLDEAVAKVPVEEPALKGTVIDVVQKGYKLRGKVIRYAKVVVGE